MYDYKIIREYPYTYTIKRTKNREFIGKADCRKEDTFSENVGKMLSGLRSNLSFEKSKLRHLKGRAIQSKQRLDKYEKAYRHATESFFKCGTKVKYLNDTLTNFLFALNNHRQAFVVNKEDDKYIIDFTDADKMEFTTVEYICLSSESLKNFILTLNDDYVHFSKSALKKFSTNYEDEEFLNRQNWDSKLCI